MRSSRRSIRELFWAQQLQDLAILSGTLSVAQAEQHSQGNGFGCAGISAFNDFRQAPRRDCVDIAARHQGVGVHKLSDIGKGKTVLQGALDEQQAREML